MADFTVTPLGGGVYRIGGGGRARLAYAAADADARWVFVDGRVWVIDWDDRRVEALPHPQGGSHASGPDGSRRAAQPVRGAKRRGRGDDHGALAAPMPATVVRIIVEPGQRVTKGDVLVMLEAMKMELPIKAPRDAIVKAIACRAGDLVQPGVPLLELE